MEHVLKTYIPKPKDIKNEWLLIDATDQRLGRLATKVATLLRGKHKPEFTPFLDTGDFVVIVNAEKISLSGNKIDQKSYFRHSTFPGGSTITPMKTLMENKPEMVLKKAIWGMIPHNALGRKVIKKLKIYAGPEHPHEAQDPLQV
jgi:large subunit ribosomal protein L13